MQGLGEAVTELVEDQCLQTLEALMRWLPLPGNGIQFNRTTVFGSSDGSLMSCGSGYGTGKSSVLGPERAHSRLWRHSMKPLALSLTALALLTSAGSAQEDWRALLQKDLVEIQGDLMVWDHFSMEQLEFDGVEPIRIQVKYHSEAPAEGLMSRDNFVQISTMTNMTILFIAFAEGMGVTMSEFLNAYDVEELDAPIGTPDLELTLVMTGGGIQFEIVDTTTGERSRETQTWAQIFSERQ